MALVESGMLLLPRSVIIFRNQLASTHRVLFAVFIIAVDGDNSEKSPHTIRLRGVYLSRRHQDRANSSPSPHYFTILASPRRYLASISLLASASSLAIFLQIFLPPRKLSRGFSPTFTPSLRLYPRSISNDTSKHQNLSLSSFLYLPLSIRLSPPRRFSIPRRFTKISLSKSTNCDEEIKKKKEKRKITRGSRFLLYDSSTMIPRINHHIKSHQQLPLPLLVSLTRTSFFLSFTPFFLSSSSPFSSPSLLTLPSSPPRPNIIAAKNDGIPRSR